MRLYIRSVIIALLAMTFVACGADKKTVDAVAEDAVADSSCLRIALVPTSGTLPFYYAHYMGLLDSVKLYTFHSQADCDTALTRGHADGAFTDVVRLVYMASRGEQLRAVMRTSDDWELVINKQMRTDKVASIKGKVIAAERFAASDFVSGEALGSAKLVYTDAFHPQINDVKIRSGMLANYQVESAVLPKPYSDALVASGHKVGYRLTQSKNSMGCMAFSRTSLSDKDKRKKIEELVAAYGKATEAMKNIDRSVFDSLLVNVCGVDNTALPKIKPAAYENARQVRLHDLKDASTWLGARGVNVSKVDLASLINTTFVTE